MNATERVQLILELLDGKATAAELAARHGIDEQELLAWRDTWLAGARAAAQPRVASRRLLMVGAVMGAATGTAGAGCRGRSATRRRPAAARRRASTPRPRS